LSKAVTLLTTTFNFAGAIYVLHNMWQLLLCPVAAPGDKGMPQKNSLTH